MEVRRPEGHTTDHRSKRIKETSRRQNNGGVFGGRPGPRRGRNAVDEWMDVYVIIISVPSDELRVSVKHFSATPSHFSDHSELPSRWALPVYKFKHMSLSASRIGRRQM